MTTQADIEGPLGAPPRLRRWGSIGWAVVGVFLALLAVYVTFAWLAGLIVPIVLALILCVLTMPLTNWLDRHMPRGVAVLLVLLLVFAVLVLLFLIFVHGIAEVAPQIQATLQSAVDQLKDALGIDSSSSVSSSADSAASSTTSALTSSGTITGWLAGAVGSLVSLFFGAFVATMVFFLVLLNPKESQGWIAAVLPWPQAQAARFFSVSGTVIFDYYKGATILALVNAVPIWLTAVVLDIEAAGSIFVVMFVSSYIPYVGAWIGGAFAVLMALGSGGTTDGLIMLVMVLLINLVLQSAVQPFAYGDDDVGVAARCLLGHTAGINVGRSVRSHARGPDLRGGHALQQRDREPARARGEPDATRGRVTGGCCRVVRGRRVSWRSPEPRRSWSAQA